MNFNLQSLLNELIDWAQAQPDILALYLYGSHAEGRANALSDVDVAVLVRENLSRQQLWWLEEQWAGSRPEVVDLRLLNLAPLPFRYEVTARGMRFWAGDLATVADLESRIWRTYWDLHPRLEHDWEQHRQRILEEQDEPERAEYQAALAEVRAVHRRVREAAAGYAGTTSSGRSDPLPRLPPTWIVRPA